MQKGKKKKSLTGTMTRARIERVICCNLATILTNRAQVRTTAMGLPYPLIELPYIEQNFTKKKKASRQQENDPSPNQTGNLLQCLKISHRVQVQTTATSLVYPHLNLNKVKQFIGKKTKKEGR
jgi:hypothetical protein